MPEQALWARLLPALLCCLLAISGSSHLFAQSAGANGQAVLLEVRNAASKSVIPFVNVFNQDKSIGITSDEFGRINLEGFSNRDTLTFQHASYRQHSVAYADLASMDYKVYLKAGHNLTEVVVSINSRQQELLSESPAQISFISSDQIRYQQSSSTADLLGERTGVFIQKTQAGGGSPIIRGFEANKVLIVVDGVRMNNAIFRSGHLQNVIALDESLLDHVEVLYGAGSTLYGSDALGGVMHFYTRKPNLSWDDTLRFSGNAWTKYASATSEKSAHLQFQLGSKKWASLTGLTFRDFGDTRSGSQRNPYDPDFGKRNQYVESVLFGDTLVDLIVQNEDPDLQRFTGYSQFNLMQKVRFKPNEKWDVLGTLQLSTSSDVPRYDRLTQESLVLNEQGDSVSQPRFAEWFYGPQNWVMGSLSASLKDSARLFDEMHTVLAFQRFEEDRISRRFGRPTRTSRMEDVYVGSFNIDLRKQLKNKHQLFYGAEFIYNQVESSAFSEHLFEEGSEPASTRYPDGGSHTQSYAAYLKHQVKISEDWILSEAIRFNQYSLQSEFIDSSFFQFPFSEITLSSGAVTGNLGLVFDPNESWNLRFNASSGFRAPNVDDIAKVFDSNPGEIIVPNNDLGPAFAYNLDLGVEHLIKKKVRLSASIWHIWLVDAIVRDQFQFNGEDSIFYEGELSQVLANVNSGRANVWGFSAVMEAFFSKSIRFFADLHYTHGWDVSNDVPLGHIPPLFGQVALEYSRGAWRSEFYLRYNGLKPLDEFSPTGVDNQEEATMIGSPSWYTLNYRMSYEFSAQMQLRLLAENLLDKHYRPFSSGVSAPGRNFVIQLAANF
jgi:hemoglobin/transferrin/lactoferrin receptor protein